MRNAILRVVAVFLLIAALNPTQAKAGEANLLDGKLRLQIAEGWTADKKDSPKTIGAWRREAAWGSIERGTHGLTPKELTQYKDRKVAEYTKGLSWLPNMKWLKKDLVQRDGRTWADLRFIGLREKARDNRDGLLYTRILATSYEGQLLELSFTSNTDENPATKDAIDRMVDSVKLAE
jgi:hypothetical protein